MAETQDGQRRLTLLAQEPDDLPALSALLQDATLRTPDIAYDARGRRLVLLVNRYRWEAKTGSRTRAAVRIEATGRVQRLHWPQSDEAVLNLLSLHWEAPHLTLTFSNGVSLRTTADALDVILEDLGEPWETLRKPAHKV